MRRAAYRAFSECEPARFGALVAGWAAADGDAGVELRRRAAEAAAWTPPAVTPHHLAWDREAEVREAYEHSARDRRDAEWAEYHVARVLAVSAPADVIRNWKHGLAVAQLGDDRTIDRLHRRSAERLPPSVRFWLERVRKAVQGRWDGIVQKWPEPWLTRRGRYEVADGEIGWGDGTHTPARIHLWLSPADRPNQYSSWGGWAQEVVADAEGVLRRWFAGLSAKGAEGPEEVRLPGRRTARILITSFGQRDGFIVFSGSGPYPDANDADGSEG